MMSLDEAIIHTQKKAEELERNAEHIKATMKSDIALQNAKDCIECANEHRQLAEWLKDYKQLKEKETSKMVKVEKWTHTKCPAGCGYILSESYEDGYYDIKQYPKWCPNCGQALKWEVEE